MPDGETLDTRIARLEEQGKAMAQVTAEARSARADLHDSLELVRTTLAALSADLRHLEGSVARMQEATQWLQRLLVASIVGGVTTVVLGVVATAATGHLR